MPVTYDQATRDRAATEIEALPAGDVLVEMMGDYAQLRAEARVCAGAAK